METRTNDLSEIRAFARVLWAASRGDTTGSIGQAAVYLTDLCNELEQKRQMLDEREQRDADLAYEIRTR